MLVTTAVFVSEVSVEDWNAQQMLQALSEEIHSGRSGRMLRSWRGLLPELRHHLGSRAARAAEPERPG